MAYISAIPLDSGHLGGQQMSAVYRCADTRLEHTVARRFLHADLNHNPGTMQRSIHERQFALNAYDPTHITEKREVDYDRARASTT